MTIPVTFQPIGLDNLAPEPAAPAPVILAMTVEQRKLDNWCWAAVGAAICDAYREPHREQCKLAGDTYADLRPCCPDRRTCDVPKRLAPTLGAHHGAIVRGQAGSGMPFFIDQINAGHPVAARMRKSGNAGHFVAIAGYWQHPEGDRLFVWDPATGTREEVSAAGFLTSFRDWEWHYSYQTQGPPVSFE